MGYFERFKFPFVIEFDILFRTHVHKGLLSDFEASATALFSKVFLEKDGTRITTATPVTLDRKPPLQQPPNKKPSIQKVVAANPATWPHKEKNGEQLCKNYNQGRCLHKKTKDGTPCTRKHACAICLKDTCKAADHS